MAGLYRAIDRFGNVSRVRLNDTVENAVTKNTIFNESNQALERVVVLRDLFKNFHVDIIHRSARDYFLDTPKGPGLLKHKGIPMLSVYSRLIDSELRQARFHESISDIWRDWNKAMEIVKLSEDSEGSAQTALVHHIDLEM